ncbi:TIGR02147 family protein, partial [Chitinivibrio alkaliphilus]|uniref:TIGR02147 family protein n=1 Tax=Chitinivibrio alkaliphilus TaxID=1505232 RepID=UPI0005529F6F
MESVFLYSDYRKYMNDYFVYKKQESYGFSYQSFADAAGFKSRGFIYRVMKGVKNLSPASSRQVAKAMDLAKKEIDYFQALVEFNQARDNYARHVAYEKMVEVKRSSRRTPDIALLTDDQIEMHSRWYHPVVRSLIGITEFSGDYQALAEMVTPAITAGQAKKSVRLLCRLGLIETGEDGVFRLTNTTVSTGDEYQSMALQKYYGECFDLAEQAMNTMASSQRNVTGLTLGLS